MIVEITVVRHGKKNGDELTILGKEQIGKVVEDTIKAGAKYDFIGHSSMHRTTQCAQIAAGIIGDVPVESCEGLNPMTPIMQAFDSYTEEAFEAEFTAIMEAGGTVADALAIGKYPVFGRDYLKAFLAELARDMEEKGFTQAICFSHSPYVTLAAKNTHQAPYHVSEAIRFIYRVDTETGEVV